MSWDPAQYLHYEDARLRSALELLARIPLAAPATIVDLGCGAGNVAGHLVRRWSQARIVGIDGDEAMLARARAATAGDARFTFALGDLAHWRPRDPCDLVYSNAALHWVDNHAALFRRLAQAVAPGGALAVQMPDNFAAPSHRLLHETALSSRWHDKLASHVRAHPVAAPAAYFDWLAAHVRTLDVWTTEYQQHLPRRDDGEHPVLAWMRGTALLPFMRALVADDRVAFANELATQLARAYPARADGSVLYAFRRLFIVALR